jgi:hypothetical protein
MKAQKRFYFPALLIFCLLLSGCSIKRYPATDVYRINDFPTPKHEYIVDVLFTGEEPDESNYIKTHFFEAHSYYGASYAQLLEIIKSQAASSNVDAVIILTPEAYEETRLLTGLGIKYKSNVDYLSKYRIVDQLYYFDSDSSDFVQIANLYPDFNNQIFEVENTADDNPGRYFFTNYIEKYSLAFLLEDDSEHWRFRNHAHTGKLSGRRYINRETSKRIDVKLNYEGVKLNHLEVTYRFLGLEAQKRKIFITYDEAGRVKEKKITDMDHNPLLKEYFTYSEEGKLAQSIYYRITDNHELPFLKTNYFYFENEDVYEYF